MARHPLHDVAVVGVCNSKQGRSLPGYTSESITLEAIRGALDDAGLKPSDLDAVSASAGPMGSPDFIYLMGLRPAMAIPLQIPIASVLEGAAAIATGLCHTILIANGQ